MREPATPDSGASRRHVPGGQLRRLALLLCCLAPLPIALAQEPEALPVEASEAAPPEATAAVDAFDEPAAIIDRLHGMLLTVMQQAGERGYAGRYEALAPIITAGFDTPLIVKVILSHHWGELNPQQQADFVELFRKLSIATYASRFNGYDREQFAEVSRETLNRGRLLIKTELRHPDKKPVRLDYLMHQAGDGQWRIISVIANGVNDLSLKRAEYAVVIKERGFDALVADIDRKIKEMESGVTQADAL
jgi:phospholipid transport system substrate-binding protein